MDNEKKALNENEVKEPEKKAKKVKEKKSTASKVSFIIGIVLCVILVPILIINSILVIKGFADDSGPPSIFGYSPQIVLTDSMSPLIDAGDMIFIEVVDPDDIKVGDVICFKDPSANGDALTTHRVVKIETDEAGVRIARTAGDYNINNDVKKITTEEGKANLSKIPDPNEEGYEYWYTTDESFYDSKSVILDEEHVVGVYAYSGVPFVGYISNFMAQPYGWIVCIGVPLLAFIIFEVLSRRKNDKTKKQDMDALLAELEALKAAKAASEQTVASEATEANESVETVEAEVADATETADPPSEE